MLNPSPTNTLARQHPEPEEPAPAPTAPRFDAATVGPLHVMLDRGTGPLVVLLHGFPEQATSWRHQVDPLVDAGYRVVVPSLRGYGSSPSPVQPEAYRADLLAGDIVRLIEDRGEEQAVVVGHDQGADIAWTTALLHPERLRGVVSLSIALHPRGDRPPLEVLRETFGDLFFYQLYFQTPGVAEAELSSDVRRFLVSMYAATSGTPTPGLGRPLPAEGTGIFDLLVEPDDVPGFVDLWDLGQTIATYERTGFLGGLNIYRSADRNWHELPELGERTIDLPSAFIAGAADPALGFYRQDIMVPPLVKDLRLHQLIPGAGHWVQQEAPQAVNAALLSFLGSLD